MLLQGHAPSPGKTQDLECFASEVDSSEASSDSWIDLLQILKGTDDDAAATKEPTQAPTRGQPACTGQAPYAPPSEGWIQHAMNAG